MSPGSPLDTIEPRVPHPNVAFCATLGWERERRVPPQNASLSPN